MASQINGKTNARILFFALPYHYEFFTHSHIRKLHKLTGDSTVDKQKPCQAAMHWSVFAFYSLSLKHMAMSHEEDNA